MDILEKIVAHALISEVLSQPIVKRIFTFKEIQIRKVDGFNGLVTLAEDRFLRTIKDKRP